LTGFDLSLILSETRKEVIVGRFVLNSISPNSTAEMQIMGKKRKNNGEKNEKTKIQIIYLYF